MVVGIIIAVIVVLIVLWAVSAYNGLVTLRNRAVSYTHLTLPTN